MKRQTAVPQTQGVSFDVLFSEKEKLLIASVGVKELDNHPCSDYTTGGLCLFAWILSGGRRIKGRSVIIKQ